MYRIKDLNKYDIYIQRNIYTFETFEKEKNPTPSFAGTNLLLQVHQCFLFVSGVCKVLEGISPDKLSEGLQSICGIHITSLKQVCSSDMIVCYSWITSNKRKYK